MITTRSSNVPAYPPNNLSPPSILEVTQEASVGRVLFAAIQQKSNLLNKYRKYTVLSLHYYYNCYCLQLFLIGYFFITLVWAEFPKREYLGTIRAAPLQAKYSSYHLCFFFGLM